MTLPSGSRPITLAGARAVLLPDRAVWLPDDDAVLVADVHWGKAATFRALQVPVPPGTTRDDLQRLDAVLSVTNASRLVVLGDLVHARAGLSGRTLEALVAWRARHAHRSITLVLGNHDARAGRLPAALDVTTVDEGWPFGPFVLAHHPRDDDRGYVLHGHVHPAVRLAGRGRDRIVLPCFAFGPRRGVLPAFGGFTGVGVLEDEGFDAIHPIADGEVLALPPRAPAAPDW